MATMSTFETLPNEMIFKICRYLGGTDVLYAFFDLNTRLNTTIEGYCKYVNLSAATYTPFHHVISNILPKIRYLVRTFVLNGDWKAVIPANILDVLFGSQLPTMFPNLQRLTLKEFTVENISLLLPNLQNFSELVALDIRSSSGNSDDDLLTRILGANNGRLKFVLFHEDCTSLNVPEVDETVFYPNIEKLEVNIYRTKSFPDLFKFLPNVRRLHVKVEDYTPDLNYSDAFKTLQPLNHLIDFQLRSRLTKWAFDEISNLIQRMPSLEKFSLGLNTKDERFLEAENLIRILPPSIKEINVAIHYSRSKLPFTTAEFHALWPSSLPIACLFDKRRNRILFHTVPYGFRSSNLPADLSDQMSSGWNWEDNEQVEDLSVFNVQSLAEVLLMVQHFHQLRKLGISLPHHSRSCAATLPIQPFHIELPRLQRLKVNGTCPLLYFVQAAHKLNYLDVTIDCLKNLLDDEQVCALLQKRITRLDIRNWLSTEVERLQHISQVFSNLHQLIIEFTDSSTTMDSTILAVVNSWNDKPLHWLSVSGSLSDEANQNLRQWLTDHTKLVNNDSFGVNYNNQRFILWK